MTYIIRLQLITLTAMLLLGSSGNILGQDKEQKEQREKKKFFFYWGYNRSSYATSDLRMHGPGYDYTLWNVTARDKPEEFDPKIYFNVLKLSIPQFNTRIGYQINEKWWFSLGYDHMKYVVNNGQQAVISGTIDSTASPYYAGTYDYDQIKVSKDFLQYEHTDGFNFITADIDYISNLWASKNKKLNLEHRLGLSVGIIYPRTDVIIFNQRGPNIFNLAGFGIAPKTQFRFNFYKYFFFQTTGKVGWVNMPKIQTTGKDGEWAKQRIRFIEGFWALGFNIYI